MIEQRKRTAASQERTAVSQEARTASQGADIVIRPLAPALAAEVTCRNLSLLGADERARIKQAWHDHLVLVFPGQHLTDAEQISITGIFGEFEEAVLHEAKGKHHGVVLISNQPDGMLGAGELRWHSDHSFHEFPASASLLQAMEIPAVGGDTYFNNMYLALATLPAHLRARVTGLTIKNDGSLDSSGAYRGTPVTDLLAYKGPSHPIVRTHPVTGYNALYLGRRPNAYVNGLSIPESEALLNELWAHATQPQFEYRHQWRVGDLVVWDNRAVMHRRDAFDETQRRIMHRTQCAGEKPIFREDGEARGLHPRASARRDAAH